MEPNLAMPGNPRYQPLQLIDIFGYDNLYQELARIEIATLQVLGEIGVIPADETVELSDVIIKQLLKISTTSVDKTEKTVTHHDVRAWVLEAQKTINGKLGRWLHVPLTSFDPLDTGRNLQFIRAHREVINPALIEVVGLLQELIFRFSNQLQIGRTHGQHALPITVGFWLATILSRILYSWEQMEMYCHGLVGKISGAVGAYNAQVGLGFDKLAKQKTGLTFEELVLQRLYIPPARISTQILPPEPLAYFLFANTMLTASLGQFGRDCRQLMRSEIAEIQESFAADQVGSSTMAHKRNPINFEQLEGMWLKTKNEFGKVMDTLISEHQRDLVASCVMRDFPTIIINLLTQLNTLRRKDKKGVPFLQRMTVNIDALNKNFETSANVILAEPLYIALQMAGYQGDAHKFVNHTLVPLAQTNKLPLMVVLQQQKENDGQLAEVVGRIPSEIVELLYHPEQYIGKAAEKAGEIVITAEEHINRFK